MLNWLQTRPTSFYEEVIHGWEKCVLKAEYVEKLPTAVFLMLKIKKMYKFGLPSYFNLVFHGEKHLK